MSVAGNQKNEYRARRVLTGRSLVACVECGWVHYAMTPEEKQAAEAEAFQMAERYRMTRDEIFLLELSMRRCLRCESASAGFRQAAPDDLAQAEGHIVTPVYIGTDVFALPHSVVGES
jgi:hypothetical protein